MKDRATSSSEQQKISNTTPPRSRVVAQSTLPREASQVPPKQSALNSYLSTELPKLLRQGDVAGQSIVNYLIQYGVKCIATDFDLTMLTCHSGGWTEPNSEKGSKVLNSLSPSFKSFAVYAKSKGLRLCVVTFSDSRSIPSHKLKTAIGGEHIVQAVVEAAGSPFTIDRVFGFYPA